MHISSVKTSQLEITCHISGPAEGAPVILLHGWPDAAQTWDHMLPGLHEAGFRTYVPWLRGYGPTRFLHSTTPRNGQLVALAQDLLEMAAALGLQKFFLIGHDWGARAAYIASVLHPERIIACAALSVGWGTNHAGQEMTYSQTQSYWYHWLMALDRGAALIEHDRQSFTRHIWQIWNPGWSGWEKEFETTVSAFENPDWAEITLHSYRVRWGLAPRDPAYDTLEARIAADPTIHVPTLMIQGGADPCTLPVTSEGKEKLFAGRYERHVLADVGHFPQRQDPKGVLGLCVDFFKKHMV